MVTAPTITGADHYGPIVVPDDDGANVFWYTTSKTGTKLCVGNKLYYGTSKISETKSSPSCSDNVQLAQNNFHALHIDSGIFDFQLFDSSHHFNNAPKDDIKFVVASDIHQNAKYANKILNNSGADFIISCGDMTTDGSRVQLYNTFKNFNAKSFSQALGNHEAHPEHDIFQKSHRNYYQMMNGLHFFFLHIYDDKTALPSEQEATKAIDWLETQVEYYSGPKFIVMHHPMYSTGEHGPFRFFTDKLILLIERHPEAQL